MEHVMTYTIAGFALPSQIIWRQCDNFRPFPRILGGATLAANNKEENMTCIKLIGPVSSAKNITPGGLRRLPELDLLKYSPDTAARRSIG